MPGPRPGRRSRAPEHLNRLEPGRPSGSRRTDRHDDRARHRHAADQPGQAAGGGALSPTASPDRGAAGCAARLARHRLPGLAGAVPRLVVLVDRHVHRQPRHDADPGQLPEDRHQRDLSDDRVPDRDHGQRGHADLHRGRLPDRVLHGAPRVAADAWTADRLGPAAVVVGLPRQGLRLAAHAQPERRHQLGPRAVRARGARLQHRGGVARRELPVAAVHDHPDLRRPGTDPVLDVRGVGRSRRASRDHLPAGRPAAGPAGRHRGRHLHVQPDARRLHHADPRVEHEVHRQPGLRPQRARATSRSPRPTRWCPSRSCSSSSSSRADWARSRRSDEPAPLGRDRAPPRHAGDPRVHLRPDRDHRPLLVQRVEGRQPGRSSRSRSTGISRRSATRGSAPRC